MRLLVVALVATAAWLQPGGMAYAQTEISASATLTATVMKDGPRKGDTGTRYLNIEGANKGNYASYGLVRFDVSSAVAELSQKLGKKFKIKSVRLDLTQSNASFSAPGDIKVYYTADDKTDDTGRKYPYDPKAAVLKGTAIGACKFSLAAKSATNQPPKAQGREARPALSSVDHCDLTLSPAIIKHITAGKLLTLILTEADSNVAATWAGTTNTRAAPPKLVITADK